MVEILVVVAIIAILAAILFPVFASARKRAKEASCEARLYQLGHAIEMFEQERDRFPQSASDCDDIAKSDVSHCPYPQSDNTEYVFVLPSYVHSNQPPPAGIAIAYCVEHLQRGDSSTFKVPLEGKVPILRYPTAVKLVDAKGIERWTKTSTGWQKVPETGEVPTYPTIWKFPEDTLPP